MVRYPDFKKYMDTKSLLALADECILLSSETRIKITESVDRLSPEGLDALSNALLRAKEKQEELLKSVFEAHPEFLQTVKQHLQKAVTDSLKEREQESIAQEADTLTDLENEINQLTS
jgi:hypothetical protein